MYNLLRNLSFLLGKKGEIGFEDMVSGSQRDAGKTLPEVLRIELDCQA